VARFRGIELCCEANPNNSMGSRFIFEGRDASTAEAMRRPDTAFVVPGR
jgi:hypothetical protein